jgi:hypothetical protein
MKQKLLSYFLFFSKEKHSLRSTSNSKIYPAKKNSSPNYFGLYIILFLFSFGCVTKGFAGNNFKITFKHFNKKKDTKEYREYPSYALTASIKVVGSTSYCNSSAVGLRFDVLGGGNGTYTVIYSSAIGNAQPTTFTVVNYKNGETISFNQLSSTTKYTLVSVIEDSTGLAATISTAFVTITTFNPVLGAIIQPDCQKATGSVMITSLPSVPWTIKSTTGQLLANGATTSLLLTLPAGTKGITITRAAPQCISSYSFEIKAQPTSINAPVLNHAQLPCNKTSFVQDWGVDADATGYRIDVATDIDFTNFVPGYENKLLGKVTSETITGISPGGTYYVRLRAVADCITSTNSNISTVFTHTTTYNGAWSDGLPDISKNVIFDNVIYTLPSNIDACTCQVNSTANITVPGNLTIKVENGVSVLANGQLTFENNASLLQINDVPNIGNINYKRTTKQIRQADYVYWSTPVKPQKLIDVSPETEDDKYFINTAPGWQEVDRNSNMIVGKGYIIRGPESYSNTAKKDYTASFIGVPNNGTIYGESLTTGKYHLIGNPYPSALSADALINGNTVLNGTFYFWTHNTPVVLGGNYDYNADDYASYNLTGGLGTAKSAKSDPGNSDNPSDDRGIKPTGQIGSGQAFFVSTRLSGPVIFNNSMRTGGDNNSQFFKLSKGSKTTTVEKHRMWINLSNEGGAFKQLLIGYIQGATNSYENKYDGISLDANKYLDFYSINNANKFGIQGRALPLEDSDVVPLGYRTTVIGNFSIEIDEVDGLFKNKAIYLEDKTSNTYHNLKNGGYEFSTLAGIFNDRFVIHYIPNIIQTPVLSEVPELTCNQRSFILSWEAIKNASSYRIDVATDEAFTNFVIDYQDREVGAYTSEEITGLSGNKYYVRLRAMYNSVVSANSNIITVSTPTTIYNGEWSNGLPDSSKNIIFDNVDYTLSSDISGCSCQINANSKVTIPAGLTLKLENGLSVKENGSLTFENNASLIQINDVTNTGNIIYKRISTPMKTFDYTYWSSPVAEQKLNILSPNTSPNKYFSLYNNNWVSESGSASMTVAKGYIIGTPQSGKWPNGETVNFPYSQPVQFIGVANNGHFEFTAEKSGHKNLIGNPYPSALDADAFLNANSSILGGTIYFWTNNTSPQFIKYVLDDYACYNTLGGVAAAVSREPSGNTNILKPKGKIASGQSFMTESLTSGTVVFENNMRLEGENAQFFKHAKTASIERHRFWLNFTSSQGAFEQILIGYADGATNNYDNRFDGRDLSGNSYTSFYSVNQNDKLTIQGRALPFDNADVVPLGYSSLLGGYFTITLDSADGLFTDQNIYLEDKKLKVFHNLKNGAYSFFSFLGTYDNRFVIHYNQGSNKTHKFQEYNLPDSVDNQVIISAENDQININSLEQIIDQVFVYDLNGKQIYEKQKVNSNEFSTSKLVFNKQLLVVKVILQNGKTVSKKNIF